MSGDALRLAHSGLEPGQRVGHYQLIEEIGRGGMGIVYRARDLNLGRQVALKRPLPQAETDRKQRRRFLREAKAAARLSHPHIVPIFEVFEHDGVPWMAMDLVEGMSLRVLLAGGRPLPVKEVLRHAEGLASALQAAHARHVLHRDVKPSNVLVTVDGRTLLTDFGLAELLQVSDSSTTQSRDSREAEGGRALVGTLRHMSPEQVLGRPLDRRSDVFALGTVVYEMCAGRPAFEGEDAEVLDAILHGEPVPLARVSYEVPAELERIVRKCLAKDPDERYQDALDLLVDVRALRHRLDFAAYAEEHGVKPVVPRRRWPRRAVGAALAGVLAVAGLLGWQRWRAQPSAPPASSRLRVGVLMPLNTSGAAETAGWPEVVQALLVRGLTGVEGLAVLDPLRLNAVIAETFHSPEPPRNRRLDDLLRAERLALVIDGTLAAAPRGYRLQLSVTAPDSGEIQASHQAMVATEASLASAVEETLLGILSHLQAEGVPLAADPDLRPWSRTKNVEALKTFLQATKYALRAEPGASAYLERAVELDPSFVTPRIWRIPVLVDSGKADEARRHYRVLQELEAQASPFDQAMIRFAGAYIAGDHAGEVRHLEMALQYAPGNNILLVNLAESRMSLGDHEGALAAIEPAVQMRWRYPGLYDIQGRCLIKARRFAEARRALARSLDITPVNANVYAMLYALARREGSQTEAARYQGLYEKRCQELGMSEAQGRAGLERQLAEVGVASPGAP